MNKMYLQSLELHNKAGFRVGLLNYGATVSSITVPLEGRDLDLVLGYPELSDYLHDSYYLGATVGRYAGRIEHGRINLNGNRYQLETGDNEHCLHGGPQGFSQQFWLPELASDSKSATFCHESPDGDQGFPGKLAVGVRYSLVGDYGLLIEFEAASDRKTVINLSNHAYFNLSGRQKGNAGGIGNHNVVINADRYARLDPTHIPTGELHAVRDSRFDFRQPILLERRLSEEGFGAEFGYDHSFELNRGGDGMEFAAAAHSPDSGLWLKVHTTQPALQFYTGEYLGSPMQRRGGFCFEAQNFPDAPNQPAFPCAVLEPGNTYSQSILYEFGHADCWPI